MHKQPILDYTNNLLLPPDNRHTILFNSLLKIFGFFVIFFINVIKLVNFFIQKAKIFTVFFLYMPYHTHQTYLILIHQNILRLEGFLSYKSFEHMDGLLINYLRTGYTVFIFFINKIFMKIKIPFIQNKNKAFLVTFFKNRF